MIINFLGHLHPVFVHLPIGFLVIAYVIQYLFKSNAEKSRLIDFVLVSRNFVFPFGCVFRLDAVLVWRL